MASLTSSSLSVTRKQAAVLLALWLLIALKCLAISWAVRHWQLPFAAGWLIWPTLAFAALATALWLGHRGDED